jgi:hypothetical protein
MLDFPIDELMNRVACLAWLERHLHPDGLRCPRCGAVERRPFRPQATFPAYRCKQCDRYYTILTGTVFAKTHQLAGDCPRRNHRPARPRVGPLLQTGPDEAPAGAEQPL